MRILIFGGREYGEGVERKSERVDFVTAFAKILDKHGMDVVIINGGCKSGADKLARSVALGMQIDFETYPARWKKEGKAAGPRRNQRMIDEHKPDAAVGFPGGSGSADMLRRLRAANIPTWLPYGGFAE